jgi:hypothetical protein
MVTVPHDDKAAPLTDDGSNRLLLEVARTIRDNLHTLFGMSMVFLTCALPWVVLATLTSWAVAWPLLVLTVAPIWATIVACADRLLVGDVVGWRVMAGDFRRHGWRAVANGMLPAICGTVLLIVASGSFDAQWKGMAMLAATGTGIALLVLAIPAVPLAVRYHLSGLALWETSAAVVVRRPWQMLGTVALAAIGLWMAVAFGPAILLGAAPFGVLVAAITQPDPEMPSEQGGFIAGRPVLAMDKSKTGRDTY